MILYPAIDLKDGNCVRLLRGDMEAATVFGSDPAAQGRAFQDAGAEWLHLVDLDGNILATGGGAVLRRENRTLLKGSGLVIFLDRSPWAMPPRFTPASICPKTRTRR